MEYLLIGVVVILAFLCVASDMNSFSGKGLG